MKRYMSLISSGAEGLDFPDLLVTNAEGHKRTVRIKRNEFIPTDKLESATLERSLATGCLGNAIRAGWVIVLEDGQQPPVVVDKSDAEKLAEFKKAEALKQAAVEMNANKSQEQMANEYRKTNINTETVVPGAQIYNNAPKVVEVKAPEVATPITPLESFNNLNHFSKLGFIAKCTDKALLNSIIENSKSKQIVNNSTKRIKSLG